MSLYLSSPLDEVQGLTVLSKRDVLDIDLKRRLFERALAVVTRCLQPMSSHRRMIP